MDNIIAFKIALQISEITKSYNNVSIELDECFLVFNYELETGEKITEAYYVHDDGLVKVSANA